MISKGLYKKRNNNLNIHFIHFYINKKVYVCPVNCLCTFMRKKKERPVLLGYLVHVQSGRKNYIYLFSFSSFNENKSLICNIVFEWLFNESVTKISH